VKPGKPSAAPKADAKDYGDHKGDTRPITEPQRKRLWAIAKNAGRSEAAIKAWLVSAYGWDSTASITREAYDGICQAVEAQGPLPLKHREPGEEG
jgi:hypothetical protein